MWYQDVYLSVSVLRLARLVVGVLLWVNSDIQSPFCANGQIFIQLTSILSECQNYWMQPGLDVSPGQAVWGKRVLGGRGNHSLLPRCNLRPLDHILLRCKGQWGIFIYEMVIKVYNSTIVVFGGGRILGVICLQNNPSLCCGALRYWIWHCYNLSQDLVANKKRCQE